MTHWRCNTTKQGVHWVGLFVGHAVPAEGLGELAAQAGRVAPEGAVFEQQSPERLHIALLYNHPKEREHEIKETLSVASFDDIEIAPEVTVWGPPSNVAVAKVAGESVLNAHHATRHLATGDINPTTGEQRAFIPHMTVGRYNYGSS